MSLRHAPGFILSSSCLLAIVSCGGDAHVAPKVAAAPSATASSAPPPEPSVAIPTLRIGKIEPIEHNEPLAGKVATRSVHDGFEYLAIDFERPVVATPSWAFGMCSYGTTCGSYAVLPPSDPPATVIFGVVQENAPTRIWVRRATADSAKAIDGEIYTSAKWSRTKVAPGEHYRFHVASDPHAKNDPKGYDNWLTAFGKEFGTDWREPNPIDAFAITRINELRAALEPKNATSVRGPRMSARSPGVIEASDIDELMQTSTGVASVQKALQTNRSLFLRAAEQRQTIAITSLEGPKLATHPWKELTAQTPRATPKDEPLARAVPAEFYYFRSSSLTTLLLVLDRARAWNGAAKGADREIGTLYETQLGLETSALTRVLGDLVIGEVAIVGSDPYVDAGTDVTLVMRVKDRATLATALDASLARRSNSHGNLTTTKRTHAGVEIDVAETSDGAVRRQRASAGDLEIVSNSAGAIDRILETIAGTRPNLASEPDFRYMRARDADVKDDLFAFWGDRFVAEVVGPKQKIAEARREIALAELETPGFAALLFGRMNGRSPKDTAELVHAGLLGKNELTHATGERIVWNVGEAARSSWGTSRILTPILDLPAPTNVTVAERDAYTRFRDAYYRSWSQYIDPIAIRIGVGANDRFQLDVRQLPLAVENTDVHELEDTVGKAHVDVPTLASGARAVLGIGADTRLRHELSDIAMKFDSRHSLSLDWLGAWALLGVDDDNQVAASFATLNANDLPQVPVNSDNVSRTSDFGIDEIAKLPLYVAIDLKSTASAALMLVGLHRLADDSMPGQVEWKEIGKEHDVSIVGVRIGDRDAKVGIFYAIVKGTLILSLKERVIREKIVDALEGKEPLAIDPHAPASAHAAQFVVDLSASKSGALWTMMSWFVAEGARSDSLLSKTMAGWLLRGAPEHAGDANATHALGLAYLGAVPIAPDGKSYHLAKEGISTDTFGSAYAPEWPQVPIAGSPEEALLEMLAHLRTEIAFDEEGKDAAGNPVQSLHARAAFDFRAPK